MSSVDDILYAPIAAAEPWRLLCHEIVEYITVQGPVLKPMKLLYPIDRIRPKGSLLLERLMELYHLFGQRQFFFVVGGKHTRLMETFYIDGSLIFNRYEDGGAPMLGSRNSRSIRDMNLVPNTYNRNYVFGDEHTARAYFKSL
jgi:hypothetical protein